MLVSNAGMPLQFANRYAYSMIEKPGRSISSIKQALYVISRTYLWAEIHDIDLEKVIFYGEFLTPDQISDLADFIYFTSTTQNKILEFKQKQADNYSHRSDIISFKRPIEIEYKYTSTQVYANRLRALRKFFQWIMVERQAQRISTDDNVVGRSEIAIIKLTEAVPRVRPRQDNEYLEAVDLSVTQKISEVLHPDHPENPFSSLFHRRRNHLLILLLIESGGRRREIYNTTSKDIIASTLQYDIKISKTTPRTLPVSKLIIDAFELFHEQHWRHLNGRGKKSGFLFVKSNGERMTLRSVNYVIETIRRKVSKVPIWFHTHTIRRSFNHRLSLLIDLKKEEGHNISHEEERQIRNRLNGWSKNSNMGEIYNARHVREKADRLAETVLNDIWNRGSLDE